MTPSTLLVRREGGLEAREVPRSARWLYESLPQRYHDDDEDRSLEPPYDRPLLRYLCGIGEILDALEELVDRIAYVPLDEGGEGGDTSDLLDPATADEAWLPWLARLVGIDVSDVLGVVARRDAIASAGYVSGTRRAIADAARSALTGSRYVRVDDHAIYGGDPPGVQPGGVWDVLLTTRVSETPDLDAVLEAVHEKGAKPAGIVLHHRAYQATWAIVATLRPTWADWHAAGSWTALMETGAT
jgi:hypothetical protein